MLLDDLVTYPNVVLGRLEPAGARALEQLLADTGSFDVLAGWVVHTCRQRNWPALTTDPNRLRRLDPDLPVDLM